MPGAEEKQLLKTGPGRGSITRHLPESTGCLDAVELDSDMIQSLAALRRNLRAF